MPRFIHSGLVTLLVACCLPLVAHGASNADIEPAAAESSATPAVPDPRIGPLLKAHGTPYTIDDDGDYRILVDLGDDRTQIVWVRSVVHETGEQRIREVWTYGYRSDERRIPATVANRLLSENFDLILGAWARSEGNAVLVLKIPADADADTLNEAIDLAASIGDRMEKQLVSGDEL